MSLETDRAFVCGFACHFCSLAKPEHVEKLFNYVTKEPARDASENVKFRYVMKQLCVGGRR